MGLLLLMGNSGAAFSGALDTLGTGLESAWSVGRRLRTGYTSNIIRVRRSSDNAESDFGYLANGAVDVAAVAAFCGAGDGFLTTIYDQSGAGRNLTSATTTQQPLVVSSGVAQTQNGRLWGLYNGATSSRRMTVTSSTAIYKFLHDGTASTMYFVASVTNDANFKGILGNIVSGTDIGFRLYMASDERLVIEAMNGAAAAVNVTKQPALATNVTSVFVDADNATAASREDAWLDGAAMTVDNAATASPSTANATRSLFIGMSGSGTLPLNGAIGEIVIWSQDRTASRATWEANAKTFWGTP